MSITTQIDRLAPVLRDITKPGTCEASLAILKGMTASEQAQAGTRYATEMKGLSLQYKRFSQEAPTAAQAAQTAIDLGL